MIEIEDDQCHVVMAIIGDSAYKAAACRPPPQAVFPSRGSADVSLAKD
jgi:hypothetical protein